MRAELLLVSGLLSLVAVAPAFGKRLRVIPEGEKYQCLECPEWSAKNFDIDQLEGTWYQVFRTDNHLKCAFYKFERCHHGSCLLEESAIVDKYNHDSLKLEMKEDEGYEGMGCGKMKLVFDVLGWLTFRYTIVSINEHCFVSHLCEETGVWYKNQWLVGDQFIVAARRKRLADKCQMFAVEALAKVGLDADFIDPNDNRTTPTGAVAQSAVAHLYKVNHENCQPKARDKFLPSKLLSDLL